MILGERSGLRGRPGLGCVLTLALLGLLPSLVNGSVGQPASATTAPTAWYQDTIPSGSTAVNGISCVNSSDCWAATANRVIDTTDGGTVWTGQQLPTNPELSGIACVNTSDCWAVGNTFGPVGFIMATIDGGTVWATQTAPPGIGRVYGITCVNATDCWAVGTSTGNAPVIIATTNSGATWVTEGVPPGFTEFGNGQSRSITCFNAMDCWAVGTSGTSPSTTQAVIATTDGGTSWTSQTPPHAGGQLSSVACTSSLDCWAVGTNDTTPAIIATTDGGTSWSRQTVPSGVPELTDVACVPGSTSCWASGETTSTSGAGIAGFVLNTTNGGTTWSIQATFPETSTSGGELLSVSCPKPATVGWARRTCRIRQPPVPSSRP